jgi:pyruvate formate lyase activating enzyme
MQIAGYLKTSVIEWSGKIVDILFVPGCNFRCPFCHNTDLVRMTGLQDYSERSVLQNLKTRKKWLDGVVITGGEPTLQPDLPRFLRQIKKLGLATMIETNGSRPEMIDRIVNNESRILDYASIDFKTKLADYPSVVGVKNFDSQKWLTSLNWLIKSKTPFEIRTTIVPRIHDLAVLRQMAQKLCRFLTTNNRQLKTHPVWYWQNFRPGHCLDLGYNKLVAYSKEELEQFSQKVSLIYPTIKIRN